MKIRTVSLVFLCVFIFSSCIEHRPKEFVREKINNTPEDSAKNNADTYIKATVYEGKIPCEDCNGINIRLILKGEDSGIFRMTETYKKPENETESYLVFNGQWEKKNTQTNSLYILSQGTFKDSIRRMTFEIKDNQIFLISENNIPTKDKASYRLYKKGVKKKLKS